MPDPTDSITAIAKAMFAILDRDQAELAADYVFYGDQKKVPGARTLCVEPGLKQRALAGQGASNRTTNEFTIYVLGYVQRVDDISAITEEGDLWGEQIEAKIHENSRFDGLVIRGFCTSIQYGYVPRVKDELWRTFRITWQGMNKTFISIPGV